MNYIFSLFKRKQLLIILIFNSLFSSIFAQIDNEDILYRIADGETNLKSCLTTQRNSNLIHLVFSSEQKIMYSRSYGDCVSGNPSQTEIYRPSSNITEVSSPCIASSGSYVYIFWTAKLNGISQIFYSVSKDMGSHWNEPQYWTDSEYGSVFPSVTCNNEAVYIVWRELSNQNSSERGEIYFAKGKVINDDNSIIWEDRIKVSSGTENKTASISISGQSIHVVWIQNNRVIYRKSLNSGDTWSDPEIIDGQNQVGPINSLASIDSYGNDVHVVWMHYPYNQSTGYLRYRTFNGTIWTEIKTLVKNSIFGYPSIQAEGNNFHIVFEGNYGKSMYYVGTLYNGIWDDPLELNKYTWEGDIGGVFVPTIVNQCGSTNPSLTLSNDKLHIIFTTNDVISVPQNCDYTPKVYYCRITMFPDLDIDDNSGGIRSNTMRVDLNRTVPITQDYLEMINFHYGATSHSWNPDTLDGPALRAWLENLNLKRARPVNNNIRQQMVQHLMTMPIPLEKKDYIRRILSSPNYKGWTLKSETSDGKRLPLLVMINSSGGDNQIGYVLIFIPRKQAKGLYKAKLTISGKHWNQIAEDSFDLEVRILN